MATKNQNVFKTADKILSAHINPLSTLKDKNPSTFTDEQKNELAAYAREWLKEKLGPTLIKEFEDMLAVSKWGGYKNILQPFAAEGTARRKADKEPAKVNATDPRVEALAAQMEHIQKMLAELVPAK